MKRVTLVVNACVKNYRGQRSFCTDGHHVSGLKYIQNYISEADEQHILSIVENGNWFSSIRRRTQYYGPIYYHTKHYIPELQPTETKHSNSLDSLQFLIDRFTHDQFFDRNNPPTQCLVNEYLVNHGIADHIDDPKAFGACVVSLSLLEPCVMSFTHIETKEKAQMILEPRSLLVLRDDARFCWKHGIPSKKHITLAGTDQSITRDETYRRLSLTFRVLHMNELRRGGPT